MPSRALRLAVLTAAVAGLAGCETAGGLPPTQVVRTHLNNPLARGTISVQPLSPEATGSLAVQPFAAAVQAQLTSIGYTPAGGAGVLSDYVALIELQQHQDVAPPRRSLISIGLGAGGYSGGWRGGSSVGGGVSFPVGSRRGRPVLLTELAVTIKRRSDQTEIWAGHARTVADARSPAAAADATANKLASALFTGFPGVSGRMIEIK